MTTPTIEEIEACLLGALDESGYNLSKFTKLSELQLDSLDVVEIIIDIEDEFDREIQDDWAEAVKDMTIPEAALFLYGKFNARTT